MAQQGHGTLEEFWEAAAAGSKVKGQTSKGKSEGKGTGQR
jgi:hypothetical protein